MSLAVMHVTTSVYHGHVGYPYRRLEIDKKVRARSHYLVTVSMCTSVRRWYAVLYRSLQCRPHLLVPEYVVTTVNNRNWQQCVGSYNPIVLCVALLPPDLPENGDESRQFLDSSRALLACCLASILSSCSISRTKESTRDRSIPEH